MMRKHLILSDSIYQKGVDSFYFRVLWILSAGRPFLSTVAMTAFTSNLIEKLRVLNLDAWSRRMHIRSCSVAAVAVAAAAAAAYDIYVICTYI